MLTNIKTIHFFGCSFTAGHELPDNDIFPWKKDCKTPEEYFNTLINIGPGFGIGMSIEHYVNLCKSMAYPSIIENMQPEWKCVNHAKFGASIKEQIYKAIRLIENNIEPIDFIVFQMPAPAREFVLNNKEKLESFTINSTITNGTKFNEYLEKSVMFHSINHWTVHAQIDLLMFEGYLLSKNIKFIFVDIDSSYDNALRHLKEDIRLPSPIIHSFIVVSYERLLALHFNLESHYNLAQLISDKIKEII